MNDIDEKDVDELKSYGFRLPNLLCNDGKKVVNSR